MPFALTNQGGTLMSSGPTDSCKTPSPSGTVPMPYPNVAQMTTANSGKLAQKVSIAGSKAATAKSETQTSNGDEGGTAGGGVVSSKIMGPCGFLKGSMTVKIEGNPAVRLGDPTKHNGLPNNNTVGSALAPGQTKVDIGG